MKIMKKLKIKRSWRRDLYNTEVTIEFESQNQLMSFVNSRNSVVETSDYGHIYIVQMKSIKNNSLDAIIRKVNLREYNLEKLLGI